MNAEQIIFQKAQRDLNYFNWTYKPTKEKPLAMIYATEEAGL